MDEWIDVCVCMCVHCLTWQHFQLKKRRTSFRVGVGVSAIAALLPTHSQELAVSAQRRVKLRVQVSVGNAANAAASTARQPESVARVGEWCDVVAVQHRMPAHKHKLQDNRSVD